MTLIEIVIAEMIQRISDDAMTPSHLLEDWVRAIGEYQANTVPFQGPPDGYPRLGNPECGTLAKVGMLAYDRYGTEWTIDAVATTYVEVSSCEGTDSLDPSELFAEPRSEDDGVLSVDHQQEDRLMLNEEIILQRKQVALLVHELSQMLAIDAYYQFKIRFADGKITVIPHASPVEIE